MIDKIILKIGERKIELTEDEARQYWADLNPRFNSGTFMAPIYSAWTPYPTYDGTSTINTDRSVEVTTYSIAMADVPFTYTS